jgi:hypothetical protein
MMPSNPHARDDKQGQGIEPTIHTSNNEQYLASKQTRDFLLLYTPHILTGGVLISLTNLYTYLASSQLLKIAFITQNTLTHFSFKL